jgi:hypothetical protein
MITACGYCRPASSQECEQTEKKKEKEKREEKARSERNHAVVLQSITLIIML